MQQIAAPLGRKPFPPRHKHHGASRRIVQQPPQEVQVRFTLQSKPSVHSNTAWRKADPIYPDNRLVFLGEQSGKSGKRAILHPLRFVVLETLGKLTWRNQITSWQDLPHHAVHVRFVRQHVPGHDWHRFSLQGDLRHGFELPTTSTRLTTAT